MENKDCPFCNISKEKTRIIDETLNTFTILSNPALVKCHCLVVPKKHVEKLSELSEDEIKEIFFQVLKIQELLLKKFPGCDIRQNYRPFQKQNHFKVDHLHVHLQPREFEDQLYKECQTLEKDIFRDLSQEELDEIKKKIENAN